MRVRLSDVTDFLIKVARASQASKEESSRPSRRRRPSQQASSERSGGGGSSQGSNYPGDFTGSVVVEYDPNPDGNADPGEIVWTWVPYEEDHSKGKDRPVLIIGRDGAWLLGLQLTSKDHDRDAADEARHGRRWMDIGTGDWDSQRRPSEVRLDRILRIDPHSVRREGATLSKKIFRQVADSL